MLKYGLGRVAARSSGRAEAGTHPAQAAVAGRRRAEGTGWTQPPANPDHGPLRRPLGACARRPANQFTAAPQLGYTCVVYDSALTTIERAPSIFLKPVTERETSLTDKIASQVEMPSSLFGELGGGGLLEDQRAFHLALELSMLSLGETLPTTGLASPLGFAPPPDDRAKKSQNMTECVPVPSSEHVAEIVGRQGMYH